MRYLVLININKKYFQHGIHLIIHEFNYWILKQKKMEIKIK